MAGRIRDQDIEEVRRKAGLIEIASEYMQVRKAGSARFKALCPFHQEKTPSFSLDAAKGLWHCLAAETGVLTWEGTVPIEKLAGRSHRLLTTGGVWVDAEVKSFGVQRLWGLRLSRNGVKKTLFATHGHRWLVRKRPALVKLIERHTTDLDPGDSLAWAFPNTAQLLRSGPAPFGIAQGFTFGDGTRQDFGSVALFQGGKDHELLRFFPEAKVWNKGLSIGRLPLFFKDLPPLNEAPGYLYGWLAGLFAADGCVATDGQVILSSASRDVLEFVRTLANRLGIGTYGIKHQRRLGYGTAESDLFHVTFINSTLDPSFFVLSKHRDRFELAASRTRHERKGWVVEQIEATDREEEVFCAVVPGTHAFTLEDNILTGNCFGCGKGGDAISLVMELETLTFVEAVERLAEKVGVRLAYEQLSAKDRHAAGRKQRLISAHREAIAFYHNLLMTSPEAKQARDYLKQRGLAKETVEAFSLGWASPRWDELCRYLSKKRFAEAELIDAGLALRSERGGLIDRFRGRVMFPHFDRAGDPIGFGGRVLDNSQPKYLNTAETPVFKKGHSLYGLNWAKGAISATRRAIVVEGYMDVIALHQAGIKETVATNGTTLTTDHFELIRPFEPRVVVVAFDSDEAGSTAMGRAFQASLDSGLDVRAVGLDNKDPAEFVVERGGEAFRAKTASSEPVSVFRLRMEVKRAADDNQSAEGTIRAVRPIFAELARHPTLYAEGVRIVAGLLRIDSSVMEQTLREMGLGIDKKQLGSTTRVSGKLTARASLEREVLQLALQYPESIQAHLDGVEPDMFSVPAHRMIWREVVAGTDIVLLRERLTDENARGLLSQLTNEKYKGELGPDGLPSDSYIAVAVNRMKDFALRRLIVEKKDQLQKLNPIENEEEYRKRYAELIALEGESKRVSGVLGEETE